MLGIFVVQLPFSVCAVWCLLVLFKGHKDRSDRLMAWVMGLLAVSFYCGTGHMDPQPDYERLVICDVLMQFCTLAVFPVICFYIRSCYEENRERWYAYLFTLPAIILTVSAVILTSMLGVSHCAWIVESIHSGVVKTAMLTPLENAYVTFTFKAYFVTFFIGISISLVYVFSKLFAGKFRFNHIPAFLRGDKSSFVANVICLLFVIYFILWGLSVVFGTIFMDTLSIWSSLWSLVTSIVLFLIGYVATVPSLPGGYINMERMRHPFSAMKQSRQEFLQGIESGPLAGAATSGYDKIMDSFKQHMEKEQGFLNPAITIEEIARTLNSNRTYVSKLVNLYYGMPFRDYLNQLRMNYAKQLMNDEPDASLDYISAKSGFQSSTQFIRKFRETEGVTPTVWKQLQRSKK